MRQALRAGVSLTHNTVTMLSTVRSSMMVASTSVSTSLAMLLLLPLLLLLPPGPAVETPP